MILVFANNGFILEMSSILGLAPLIDRYPTAPSAQWDVVVVFTSKKRSLLTITKGRVYVTLNRMSNGIRMECW